MDNNLFKKSKLTIEVNSDRRSNLVAIGAEDRVFIHINGNNFNENGELVKIEINLVGNQLRVLVSDTTQLQGESKYLEIPLTNEN